MSFKRIMAVLAVASLVLTATVAQAGVVAIQNGSFESGLNDWVVVDSSYFDTFTPAGGDYPAAAQDGDDAAYAMPMNDGRIYQKLTTDGSTEYQFASVGDKLTVNFYLAKHLEAGTVGFHVNLWADDVPDPFGSGGYIGDSGGLTPPDGAAWEPYTFIYTAKLADVNETLWLQLDNSPAGAMIMIDAVSASYAPIPEPSTLVLLIAGLIGLLCYAWRKRK